MGGYVMKKIFALFFVLAIIVSFSTQYEASAARTDDLPEIMRTFTISATK